MYHAGRNIFALTSIIFFIGCSQPKQVTKTSYNGHPLVDFCNLPNYQNKEVFTRAIYSGVMEYWSLSSLSECKNGFQVDLDFLDYAGIPEKFKNIFNKNQSFKRIIIEAVGIFETGRKEGYGHLGSNNSRFLVSKLVDVKGINY
jgi:hypothetical protein